MSVETVDAVVVGAGQNGLVAANVLADAGWDVLVLEAADVPGGSVASAEITAPGFRSDLCSAFYPLGVASPVFAELDLGDYGLRWRRAPAVLAHVLPDQRVAVVWPDAERTAESVAAFAPADAAAWQAEVADWQRLRTDLLDALLRPFPPVRAGARLLRRVGTADALRLVRRLTLSVRRLGEERFAGAGARLLYAGNALHTDLGPDVAGSAAFGWLLAMLAQDVGFPVPEGGADQITGALLRRLTARGGRVECGRRVSEVLVAGGRALGVRDAAGQPVRARHAVLADVPAPALYRELVAAHHLPARLLADLDGFQWDNSTIKVDWALSTPIPWLDERVGRSAVVHLGTDLDGLSTFSAELTNKTVPRDPFVILGQMTTSDPSRSPEGTEVVWAYTHVPRGIRWSGDDLRRAADRLEQVIQRHAPGFTDRVLARSVQGPADLEGHNRSLVEGAINAGTAAIHQQLVLRPVPGLGRADTPVDRLFLASASAHPGGGVHGACGANAARAALARAGLGGAAYAAAVRAAHRLIYS
ncbi:phytoene desaturase family protein [Goodfellowiella coeruleoviolacea]|uniref:Pyridine nucleotide-disulfide oxidoreductase domain-containing protein 2 n=1 Tax=Goodfellowiella coeruleoviolacea TaxID=334858 RepID=A0AAE3G9Q0_9PSEU|nr:NAD(P)/FAD-dependent oxidoreductase [Goodfellowiella coeruleoviolacea]MCP2164125.1 Phytoene dehydrogenase-related protein [Goodfellowiella coeruleoviolacea]